MSPKSLRGVARHAILTAMALDEIGAAFESNEASLDDILEWCDGPRTDFLPYDREEHPYNSAALTTIMYALVEAAPNTFHEVESFVEDTRSVIERLVDLHGPRAPLLAIGIGYGVYCAVYGVSVNRWLDTVDAILRITPSSIQEYESAMLLSFWAHDLIRCGYFGYEVLKKSDENNLLGPLKEAVDYLTETHPTPERLASLPQRYLEGLHYSQRLVLNMVFYMLRIDAAFNGEEVSSLPREQLYPVITLEGIDAKDSGFVFGFVCTASEHKHPLVPKPLRESIQLLELVDTSLNYSG